MPDQADVEDALAAVAAEALHLVTPGPACRIYRGWPTAAALEADLLSGVAHVTVQPVGGSARDTTRFAAEWQGAVPAPTLRAVVTGEMVSFQGIGLVGAGQVAGVLVDGVAHGYRVRAGDTPGVVAAVLAQLMRVGRPAELRGDGMLLPGGVGIAARVVADGHGGTELRRQQAGFRITAWCPGPASRDRVSARLDLALAGIRFLDVGGWGCQVRSAGGSVVDTGSAAGIWRRDLVYRVEYPTVAVSQLPAMLFGVAGANGVTTTV